MTVYYDPLVCCPRVLWSKTVFPRVFWSFKFWLCLLGHVALVVLLRMGYVQASASGFIPLELAMPLLGVCALTSAQLYHDCRAWHQAVTKACADVGSETRRFAQELQAVFGTVDEAVASRFAAGKYALAAVYVFFFSLTGGSVNKRGWSELRAKGLLDDREVQFMEGQYGGDRLALLHVWAMWAVQEAASSPIARAKLGSEALAGGVARLAEALRRASDAAREAAGCAAVPVPYHQFQLHDYVTLVSMLVLGAMAAARTASGEYVASVLYLAVLLAVVGLREAAAALSDPLRQGRLGTGFPVAATVNATADAVAHLLIGAVPASFDPSHGWSDSGRMLLSQNHIERRTPAAAFGTDGANPCHWPAVKAQVNGDMAPPPLLDSGCCHLDVDALPRRGAVKSGLQVARRPRQEGLGSLLARVQVETDSKASKRCQSERPPTGSTGEPSEASFESHVLPPGSAASFDSLKLPPSSGQSYSNPFSAKVSDAWSIDHTQEQTVGSNIAVFSYPGIMCGASKGHRGSPRPDLDEQILVTGLVPGTWATPMAMDLRGRERAHSSVSPDDLVLSTCPSGDSHPV